MRQHVACTIAHSESVPGMRVCVRINHYLDTNINNITDFLLCARSRINLNCAIELQVTWNMPSTGCFGEINSFWALFRILSQTRFHSSRNNIAGEWQFNNAEYEANEILAVCNVEMETISSKLFHVVVYLISIRHACWVPSSWTGVENAHIFILLRIFGKQIQCLHII